MSFHVSLVGCGSPHREDGRRHVTRTSPRKLLITQRSVLRVGRGSRPASSATATRRGSFPVSDACSRCSESAASRSLSTRRAAWSWCTPRYASSPRLVRVPASPPPCGPQCGSSEGRADGMPNGTPRASTNRLWAACRKQIALDRDRLRRVGSGSTFSNVNRSDPRSHRRLGSVRSLGVNFRSAHNYVEPAA